MKLGVGTLIVLQVILRIRQTLDSASTPPAGAFDIVDITEEEPVQPAPDEGSAPKKKRMTKAAKEAVAKEAAAKEAVAKEVGMNEAVAKDAAAKVAKQMGKQPMDATTAAASCGPSFPALVMEGHFLNLNQQGTSAQIFISASSLLQCCTNHRGAARTKDIPANAVCFNFYCSGIASRGYVRECLSFCGHGHTWGTHRAGSTMDEGP